MRSRSAPIALEWLPALTSALVLTFFAGAFLPHQCLWVDETTQMKGLTLDLGELIRWLAGSDPGRFGVPGDRMPPLSYVVGQAWAALFGLTESAMRWMGVCLVAGAAAVVARTARSFAGLAGSFIAGIAFALSPNVITSAVEIRAYPLFLLTSAFAFHAFSRIALHPESYGSRQAVILAAALLASMYTHFYGIFLALGLGLGAIYFAWRNRGPLRPLLISLGAAALLSLGLLPFLTASVTGSGGAAAGGAGLREFVRLPYRLFSHPSISISLVAATAAGLGVAGLLLVALLSKAPSSRSARTWGLPLALGLGATLGGGLLVRGFNPYTPAYSSWVLPGLAVLLSMAWLARDRVPRMMTVGALSLMIGSQAYGAITLATKGDLFAHGPHRTLDALVRKHGTGDMAVLHDTRNFGIAYFPLHYEFGSELKQYVLLSDSPLRVAAVRPSGLGDPLDLGALDVSRVIVVRVEWQGARELRLEARGERPPIPPGPIATSLSSGEWSLLESAQVAATAGASIHVFGRK